MKFSEHKLYIIERKDVPETECDLDITADMKYNRRWRNEAKLKDYVDGYVYLNPDGYFPETIDLNSRNITVLRYTYQKLAYIAFCLAHGNTVEEDINSHLSDFVSGIKQYINDFNGFKFPLITELKIGKSWDYEKIEYDGDCERYYDVGNYSEYQLVDDEELSKYDLDLAKVALCNKYIIIIDDMEDSYIKRMIEDNIISLDKNRIIVFDDSDMRNSCIVEKNGVHQIESEDDV